jgi:hypothetical protein
MRKNARALTTPGLSRSTQINPRLYGTKKNIRLWAEGRVVFTDDAGNLQDVNNPKYS